MAPDILRPRMARPGDYPAFVRLVRELDTGDPTPTRETWERDWMPTMLMFEDGSVIAAYAWVHPLAGTGYVRHVVVAATHRGRGHGHVVMRAAAALLREQGCTRWCLNVRPSNAPAVALYERYGMQRQYSSHSIRITWDAVSALPSDEQDTEPSLIGAADDDAVEATFGLPPGQLAHARARVDRVLVGVRARADNTWVGMASFVPGFPGAAPFRVREPSVAKSLLEALRPRRLPEHSYLRVMAEDDEALTELLLAHGGTLHVTVQHMAGQIPAS